MGSTRRPNHVGIIMDGNGRWATKRGLPRSAGHKAGAKNFRSLCEHIFKQDVKYLSVFAFSTENFKRDKEEVDYLMNLFIEYFETEFNFVQKEEVKVDFSGRKDKLPENVVSSMKEMEEKTSNYDKAVLNVCINYGGQDEIVDMAKNISSLVLNKELDINEIDKTLVQANLYHDLPPLDFVIRTSGEQRISNFMLWQSAYAEYYFPEVYFPDFNKKEFDKALEVYESRNRRFGGK